MIFFFEMAFKAHKHHINLSQVFLNLLSTIAREENPFFFLETIINMQKLYI